MTAMQTCRRCRLTLPAYMILREQLCGKCLKELRAEAQAQRDQGLHQMLVHRGRQWVDMELVKVLLRGIKEHVRWLEEDAIGMCGEGGCEELADQLRVQAQQLRQLVQRPEGVKESPSATEGATDA